MKNGFNLLPHLKLTGFDLISDKHNGHLENSLRLLSPLLL